MTKTPRELAQERLDLAYQHAKLGERLVKLKEIKAKTWQNLREESKSAAEADRKWEATDEGIEEIKIKLSMRSKELKMTAIKTYIDVLNTEAYNQY